ncbi:TPA: hypothetical protein ACH3X1_013617 [Trebouxia sp. C0004]
MLPIAYFSSTCIKATLKYQQQLWLPSPSSSILWCCAGVLPRMQDVEDEVEQFYQFGGAPVRSTRLQPASASHLRPPPAAAQYYERLKRRPPRLTEDLADDDDEQDGRQLTYKALQAVCEEAVKCNRRTANGQEHFDMQACTYVEANGLFFDDCYEDTCRLPSAPRFEERVIIQMEVNTRSQSCCSSIQN